MRIYSLLITFDLVMGWVIDWVVGGPEPGLGPLNSMIVGLRGFVSMF